VEEVDQLRTPVIGIQRCMPEREGYFSRVGGGDAVAFPIIRCPHGLLFGDGFKTVSLAADGFGDIRWLSGLRKIALH
jgi:hypothetical protein